MYIYVYIYIYIYLCTCLVLIVIYFVIFCYFVCVCRGPRGGGPKDDLQSSERVLFVQKLCSSITVGIANRAYINTNRRNELTMIPNNVIVINIISISTWIGNPKNCSRLNRRPQAFFLRRKRACVKKVCFG